MSISPRIQGVQRYMKEKHFPTDSYTEATLHRKSKRGNSYTVEVMDESQESACKENVCVMYEQLPGLPEGNGL